MSPRLSCPDDLDEKSALSKVGGYGVPAAVTCRLWRNDELAKLLCSRMEFSFFAAYHLVK